ncbi:hypothetical protein SH1V18_26610 [Vallitalea longa]|uniref:Trimethylamine corrinoid protein 2 n=1 Tax=Vallitalea longa TaxID=2936439 RepID=A0A9W6DEH3_9FIRM|nr:hypothetical protein [Vallitalea longa]GKX30181.1 hypothetical protein SH1V18_26610 [Vallitalea longa]
MEFLKGWEKTKKRLELMWENELLDRCCVCVEAPKDASNPYVEKMPDNPQELKKWYLDPDWILERNLEKFRKTHYAGDAVPSIFTYFGTGGHGKYLCNEKGVEYTRDTIWIHPVINDYDTFDFKMRPDNEFLVKELKILEYLTKEGMGKFFVGLPDNTGSFDALSQLRGNVELMMDLIDKPKDVKNAVDKIVDVLINTGDQIFDVLRRNNDGGSVHSWMGTWSKGRHMQLQCDSSVMMSNEYFKEFIVPELEKTSAWLDNAIYHLDGIEQLRHLDSLLEIKNINMIQWVQVSGQPPITEFIPELKKIQEAKKGLVLLVNKNQIEPLLNEISPRGVILNVMDAKDSQEADDIVRFVENFKYRRV